MGDARARRACLVGLLHGSLLLRRSLTKRFAEGAVFSKKQRGVGAILKEPQCLLQNGSEGSPQEEPYQIPSKMNQLIDRKKKLGP